GLGLLLWTAWALARNTAVIGYLAATPGAWDSSSLGVFLGSAVIPALAASLIFLLLMGTGRRLCRVTGIPDDGALIALPGALALGLFGTALFAAGLAGALTLGIGLCLAAVAVAGAAEAWASRGSLRLPRRSGAVPPWKTGLAAALGFSFFHILVNALAPPVGWDALAYHLAIPRLYLDADAVRRIPWLLQSYWPHLLELIYAAPLALGRESCAALLHAAIGAALVFTVYRVGREEGGEAVGWTAAALLAAQPVFLEVAAEPHCDAALALFHLLACLCLWRWSKEGGGGLLAAAGLCSGLAAAVKLQGLALTGVLLVWLLLAPRRRAGAAAFLIWAALPAAPWYLKTWLAAGNPVWPFYSGLFGGRSQPELVAEGLVRLSTWRFPRDAGLLWRYGPQFLLLPAAALAALAAGRGPRLPPRVWFLFLATAPLVLITARYHEGWRYLLPLMPAIALAAGWWCVAACRLPGPRRAAAALFVALGLWPAAASTQSNELFAVLALHSRAMPGVPAAEVYRARQLPFYLFYRKAEAAVPPGERVLLFREIRGYHLRADYQWGDPVMQTQILYDRIGSPEALREALEQRRLNFVLINEANGLYGPNEDYYSRRTLALMDAMLARYGREALREGPLVLHALRPLKERP
ncbi:MAG: glycosyltransferase family 39 protein, partial [Elusimicrobiota bacterium]|nr:glycosyltransferase family 39 protein [Elusimicrobiota bacterium]